MLGVSTNSFAMWQFSWKNYLGKKSPEHVYLERTKISKNGGF